MAGVWLVMQRTYGNRWSNQYGDRDDGTWGRQLVTLGSEEFSYAVEHLVEHYPSFPPTLGEFMQLAHSLPRAPEPFKLDADRFERNRRHAEEFCRQARQTLGVR